VKAIDRRTFISSGIKVLATGLLSSLVTVVLPPATGTAGGTASREWPKLWQQREWGFVVDARKCIGCGTCVWACKRENGVPMDREVYRTWVERYVIGPNDQLYIESPQGGASFDRIGGSVPEKSFFVPKLCNQCADPPCVQVCPVGATYRTGDGVVLVDRVRCVGCRYCIQACPYGARFLHPDLMVADKCTWCYHRISKGMLPACVQVCPVGARIFGNLKDKGNPVTPIMARNQVQVLKPDMGTEPRVFYLGLDKVVR